MSFEKVERKSNSFMLWHKEQMNGKYEQAGAEGVHNIVIDVKSADVTVTRGRNNTIGIRLTGNMRTAWNGDISIETQRFGDELEIGIRQERSLLRLLDWGQLHLEVELPPAIWSKIRIYTGSGNVRVKELKADTVYIATESGDLFAADIVAGQLLDMHTESGDIDVEWFDAGRTCIRTGSGDLKLIEGMTTLIAETGSGDIEAEELSIEGDTELHTGSGDIFIRLAPEPLSLALDYVSRSGDGSVTRPGFVGESRRSDSVIRGKFGDGEVQLRVRTGSGDFTLA
ncbi:DUF4097 family beta strand repeat-containing protein [Paenibacillus xylaniclasticus]|uniref:DUF4097 family beta strand repeat-containing protein n=1 Tax=Paenibacillus xylaniclasticus TaxID=588083 RepID=UPI000FDBC46D|nr:MULTISPECIES: DUF4097 family beta strand repeat-containing protein [Paenibacillus]GFN33107.1 hypothetical protein PCURB6_33670 [Paenibacillus curdlanolyticus]